MARFNTSDGKYLSGPPALDGNGNLIGLTDGGGHGWGVLYRVALNGTLDVLHKFQNGRDGSAPYGSVVIDASGNIYGASSNGGTNGNGAVWEIPAPAK